MSSTVRQAEPDTAKHQDRVAVLAREMALELEFEAEVVDTIGIAAQLHDIGKIGKYVLPLVQFNGSLDEDQWRDMRSHPVIGAQILRSFDCPWRLYPIVWGHHERLDGSGYPEGLKGDDISLPTGVVSVADVVEAMSTSRGYRSETPGLDMALEHIFKNGGVLFHPDAVEACLNVFVKRDFDFPGVNYIQ